VPLSKCHSERYNFVQEIALMRRLFADRLALATGIVIVLKTVVFALLRLYG
jgi:hypothetical protein